MPDSQDRRSQVLKDAAEAVNTASAKTIDESVDTVTLLLGRYRRGLLAQGFTGAETLEMLKSVQSAVLFGVKKS